jgi:hypothetical protein
MSFSSTKVHEHLRDTLARGGSQLVDAADGVDGLFDLGADLGLDLLRRRTRQLGDHADGREVDLGEAIDAELGITDDTEDEHHQDQHGGEDRAPDADVG